MPYKKKILILALVSCVLAVLYGFTLFFDPQRVSERNASFSWLPGDARDEADLIELIRPGQETLTLTRKNEGWFAVTGNGLEIPAKQGRIDDVFRILIERGAFPLRGSSSASHEDLGLVPETASRLVIRAGAVPLLDLFIGNDDPSGREVFLRRNGEDEFRSGERLLATYINGVETSWYDLMLFKDDLSASVQRIRVSPVKNGEGGDEDYTLARGGGAWIFEGAPGTPDGNKADEWVRSIFDVQGDYFIPLTESPNLSAGRIIIELGDGSMRVIQIGEALPGDGGTEKRPTSVSGTPYLYAVSKWVVENRLLRTRSSLE
jgi:hypothetical protein